MTTDNPIHITARGRRKLALLALAAGLLGGQAQAQTRTEADARPRAAAAAEISEAGFCTTVLQGQMFQRTELFFGRNSPAGVITEAQFQAFLDSVVTPLFPDGLTVVDATGQFRASAASPPEKEDSKLLILLYKFSKSHSDSVEEIRSRYKTSFQQQSVLRVDERSCVSF